MNTKTSPTLAPGLVLQADGKTVFVESTPMVPLYPDKPEPVRQEPVWLTEDGSQKHLGLTKAGFERAQALPEPVKFPVAARRPIASVGALL